MHRGARVGAGLLALLVFAALADAAITKPLPLKDVVGDADFVVVAKVTAFDPDGKTMVLVVEETLKGKAPLARLPLVIRGDEDAEKGKHLPLFLKRVAKDLPVVLFVTPVDNAVVALAYTNGTWFQLHGVKPEGADGYRWTFTHLEPNLRSAFTGTTPEMKAAVKEGLTNKKWPPFKKDEKGYGPEV